MVATAQALTIKDLESIPEGDGNIYELIGGVLVVAASPVKKHVRVSSRLFRIISQYVERISLERCFMHLWTYG